VTQSSPTNRHLRKVRAVSPTVAWAVGDDGVIIHTADGGANWRLQNSATTEVLLGVGATSPDVAWVVSSRSIRKTVNGGATWAAQAPPASRWFPYSVVTMSDPYQCVVLRSGDGGASWTTSAPPRCAGLWGLHPASATSAWTAGQHVDSSPAVYRTTDGGGTWTDAATGFPAGTNAVLFAIGGAEGTLWAVGTRGSVTASHDGGVTWAPQVANTGDELWGVAASSRRRVWAVGQYGTILHATP
jgi:photosystem II stability/assembly factor-like uncharacterized protein